MRILFVASEVYPLIKTGGLADVCGSLPPALAGLDLDVRVLLPAYRDARAGAGRLKTLARLRLPPEGAEAALLEGRLPGTPVRTWLLDHPASYDRSGNPYLAPDGHDWPDNAQRFARLNRAAEAIARGQAGLAWVPDVVHAHDWQAGLLPALLAPEPRRPATVFTVHNLAYQGLFPYETLAALGLPAGLWSHDALEFHGQLSFIKGGIAFADAVTTVSPTYAREIQTPEFGHGLDGLLRHHAARLSGILNGIDPGTWNPARDPNLAVRYSARRIKDKIGNKLALQKELGLPRSGEALLLGWVGRLVAQKGIDLVLEALPALMDRPVQIVQLGGGEARFEQQLRAAATRYPERIAALIGYDETLAHRIVAGADAFLMPSRFEPCGLSQLYALRYGTVPIVRGVGGLADTVRDASDENLRAGTATGIVFTEAKPEALVDACARALALFGRPRSWQKLMLTGMRQDFSWRHSAQDYRALYQSLRAASGKPA
jgi:starch synthase